MMRHMARIINDRPGDDPDPGPDPTAPEDLTGPVAAHYKKLGGKNWGFRDAATGAEKSIYWTPETGPHEVFGLIRNGWAANGWERSALGYPTTGEMLTHDGVGRYQIFEGGQYIWHPDTGAFEVHGAILARYGQLGGSPWGYPITDESRASGGRFNHFRRLPGGQELSIYWSGDTGAVEVYGAIRQRWAELGWERSHLRFPVGPETNWPEGGAGARQHQFQGGRMIWTPTRGAAADPMRWKQTINATGVRGEVDVSVHHDGTAHLGGFVRAVKHQGYGFKVHALVKTPTNLALAFSEKGNIYGDLEPGNERYNFNQTASSPLPEHMFWELQRGSLQVDKNYSGHITGAIGDLFEAALKWIAGATLIATPGTALLLVGGTGLVTALSGGSLASGARIVSGTLWLAGPFGTVFAVAADAFARLASKERPLKQEEYDLANLVFKGTLPPRTDIVVTDAIGGNNRPFTYPRFDGKMVLSVGDKYFGDLRNYGVAENDKVYGELLIHELVHVWQYHNNAASISYVGDAIWARVRDDYDPGEVLDEPWDSFGLEEQGTIVDQWFATHYNGPGSVTGTGIADDDYGLRSPAAVADQAFRFITENIRTGQN